MNKNVLSLIVVSLVVIMFGVFKNNTPFMGSAQYNDLGYDGVTNTSTSIATSTTKLFSANAARKYAYIVNDDATNAVYCVLTSASSTCAADIGIKILAKENYEISANNLWFGEVWCIADAAAVTLSTVEK